MTTASKYVGRVGGLAVALGVGAAVFSSMGVASADSGSQDATDTSSVSARRGPAAVRGDRPANRHSVAAVAASVSGSAATAPSVAALNTDSGQRRSSALSRRAKAAGRDRLAEADPVTDVAEVPAAAATASRLGTQSATPRAAAVASALSSVPDPNALAPRFSPGIFTIGALSAALSLTTSLIQQLAIAIHIGPTKSPFNQTVTFGEYSLDPASTELVTSFYGPWTYLPGAPNTWQGQQQYDVVDSTTQQTLGTVDALVSSSRLVLGTSTELIITSADAGVDAIAPYGSVFVNTDLIAGFGWAYSAVPSPSGNVVSFALTTPFGNIPIRFIKFDAAQGIADHTIDDRPIDLGNGYSIAPSDLGAEIYTGTSGMVPLFQTVQTKQRFDIRDSSGTPVGTFDGVAVTTWDIAGTYTEAILVTEAYGDNIGTGVGQVPPTGTAYNVIYSGSDENYHLSAAMPSLSGDVISFIEGTKNKVLNVLTWPVNLLNASAPPPVKRLPFAAGYGILPISELIPFGVNGLAPRDEQVQSYQQFAVYDPEGVQSGSFDAMVTNQWDFLGIASQAITVIKVTDGTAGAAAGDVPTVGSVLNYVYFGDTGFGSSYWSVPTSSGTRTSYKILTPIINIPTWSTYNASKGLDSVTFVDPFDI